MVYVAPRAPAHRRSAASSSRSARTNPGRDGDPAGVVSSRWPSSRFLPPYPARRELMVDRRAFVVALAGTLLAAPLTAEAQGSYKPEFKMSVVVSEETAWGRAALRFASAVRYRTAGRIQVKNYFNGQLFADRQTTEFQLLQQAEADFALGSTINWSPQVKELNLF